MKVLIVEDSQFKIEKITEFLLDKNISDFNIKKSYNAALKEIQQTKDYDLILLDMSIPSFDVSNEYSPSGGKNIFNQIYMNELTAKVIVITLYKNFDDGSAMENLHFQFSNDYPDNYLGYIIFNSQDIKWQQELNNALKEMI